jgi:polyhydroxyalkanoate synthesis regulator phasin
MLKLTQDVNINELVKGTTAEDLQKWIDVNLVDKGVMKKEDAYQLGMDITRMAEDTGQWNFARAYTGDGHGGIRKTTEDERNTIVESQMRKPNQQNLYRNTTRLGGGFDIKSYDIIDPTTGEPIKDAAGKIIQEKRVEGVSDFGKKFIANISDHSGFRSTGNKELKTYYMISASKDMYESNPDVWLNTADEFMAKNDQQLTEAYNIATTKVERINEGQRFGRDASGSVNYTHEKRMIQDLINKGKITEEDITGDKGKYKNLKTVWEWQPPTSTTRGTRASAVPPPPTPPTPGAPSGPSTTPHT